MTKGLIADEHPLHRRGLMNLLLSISSEWQIDEAGSGHEVLKLAWKNDYDIIILGISLPDRNGLEVLEDIIRHKPETAVLIMSRHTENLYAKLAFKAGASGYISKNAEPLEVIEAINKVLAGQVYFHAEVIKQLNAERRIDATQPPHERLSAREYEVMRLLVEGEKLQKIARRLAISKSAVSTYRQRVLQKMQLHNNGDLIRYAVKNGIPE